jgi:transcriptional regulator with XRE-family HTH domain
MAGRPTSYRSEYDEQATRLCKLGATVEELAEAFNVAVSTVSKWIKEIPSFSEAVKAGRIDADARVAEALYAQALEGNVTAAIFWLKNRRRNEWRERHEVVNMTDAPSEMTDAELERIARAGGDGTAATQASPSKPDRIH